MCKNIVNKTIIMADNQFVLFESERRFFDRYQFVDRVISFQSPPAGVDTCKNELWGLIFKNSEKFYREMLVPGDENSY